MASKRGKCPVPRRPVAEAGSVSLVGHDTHYLCLVPLFCWRSVSYRAVDKEIEQRDKVHGQWKSAALIMGPLVSEAIIFTHRRRLGIADPGV